MLSFAVSTKNNLLKQLPLYSAEAEEGLQPDSLGRLPLRQYRTLSFSRRQLCFVLTWMAKVLTYGANVFSRDELQSDLRWILDKRMGFCTTDVTPLSSTF